MIRETIIFSIGIVILLMISAFFSASETAITAASRARAFHQMRKGNKRADILNTLLGRRAELISTILLGNNFVNIMASALATTLFVVTFGELGIVYATLLMTMLIVILAEILPKTWTIQNADRFALRFAPVLRITLVVLGPVAWGASTLTKFMVRHGAMDSSAARGKNIRDELRGILAFHLRRGAVEKREHDMIEGVLDLEEVDVGDVMVHRKNMAMVDLADPPAQIVEEILSSNHTRVPLWREDSDNVVGLLHVRDLLRAIVRAEGRIDALDIGALARPVWFVPHTTTLLAQLSEFLSRRDHCALVVDEYGSLMGLISLEDILEEIVGEIVDEHDVAIKGLAHLHDGSVVAEGASTVRDINRSLDWNLPEEEAPTLAGLIISKAKRIPEMGEHFVFNDVDFEILQRRQQQITRIRMKRQSKRESLETDEEGGA